MSKEQLTQAVMALPLAERVWLAQELWQSIEEVRLSSTRDEEWEALAEAQRRAAELSSGAVAGRTHEQVMETMRQTTGQVISRGFPSDNGGAIRSPSMQIPNTENNSLSPRH